ncbi:hypothetical protein GKIL_2180 [Gloeobacter kilaueensis JS1]|uniref:Uncharacterized protein n=1 Tax=Gloeobacter kilaueensis (strain ATCC BAA-2537 / CCAP 1431/1 / ULC 316 / JS1) TaxID=1183438 RepID=U5QHM7_GLOK1|nr:hypothetical protein GKIL_2180 [Gloeobacter kilaueensis JS1]
MRTQLRYFLHNLALPALLGAMIGGLIVRLFVLWLL